MKQLSRRVLVTLVALIAGGAQPAAAQFIPGGHPRDRAERDEARRAEARVRIYEQVSETLRAWSAAWNADDVEGLTELYARDAVVHRLEGPEILRSPEEVREAFDELLPRAGEIDLSPMDYDVSDLLAFVTGNFAYTRDGGSGPPERLDGQHLVILKRQGSRWRIRAHLFRERP